ncbi:branched-chain amino acid ABC transporter permease [Rhizobium sp. LjRoot30]|uniref:branched-chain amino acid ABC transporter permease n=1 Tax=Rhizobium sp. LjRoot30 TaxID=3342320 RepID=UPI003ECE234E
MDMFLVEAFINGLLLAGVLGLLALGLNLIFGVVDVVWLSYAELAMVGTYGVFWTYSVLGWPLLLSFAAAIALCGVLGALIHYLIISPLLDKEPLNQLLATGGLLFFLQSMATLLFGTEFRNLGLVVPPIEIADMYISTVRAISFGVAVVASLGLYFFLSRTYLGTAIKAIAQDRDVMSLMGVNPRRLYLITSALGGGLAGLAACLLSLEFDIHPFAGNSYGPLLFIICVLGGLGSLIGGLVAALLVSEAVALGGYFLTNELAYVIAFGLFVIVMFIRPKGLFAK